MTRRYADHRDRCRLNRRIATGGAGEEVWQGTDTLLDRNDKANDEARGDGGP